MSSLAHALKTFERVAHPYISSEVVTLHDLPAVVTVMIRFLQLADNKGLLEQITTSLLQHHQLPFDAVAQRLVALRTLAASVEPFLKSIGRIRYALDQNNLSKINGSMLMSLLEQGLILPPIRWDPAHSGDKHDPEYWRRQDCTTAIAYRVWLLRNELSHKAPVYKPNDLPGAFEAIVYFLIVVIRESPNRIAIEFATSPFIPHLQWLSAHAQSDREKYVTLSACLRWTPSSRAEDQFPLPSDGREVTNLPAGPDDIVALFKQVNRMVLIGTGGSGKTRTLRSAASQIAVEMLANRGVVSDIPILVPAYALLGSQDVAACLSPFVFGIGESDLRAGLTSGRFCLLIDGLNEVAPTLYAQALQVLKTVTVTFPKCRVLIATRPEIYQNELVLPAYELQALNRTQVHQIIRTYSLTEHRGDDIFARLLADNRLLALFRTPLMTRLLCELPSHVSIPRNVAELMSSLFQKLFDREQSKGDRVPKQIKSMVLMAVADKINEISGKAISESDLLHTASAVVARFSPDTSSTELVAGFVQNGILERGSSGLLVFFHETALDYFRALRLRDVWLSNDRSICFAANAAQVELLAGVLDSADELICAIVERGDLQLAARCYGVRSARSKKVLTRLLSAVEGLVERRNEGNWATALRALSALDESEATRRFFDLLKNLPASLLDIAMRTLVQHAPEGSVSLVKETLVSGVRAQRLVALHFAGKTQLAEVTSLIIPLTADAQLVDAAARCLGCLDTPAARDFLLSQADTPADVRGFPLHLALEEVSSRDAAPLLVKVLDDHDPRVRRVAATRIGLVSGDTAPDPRLVSAATTDRDFFVRVCAAGTMLRMNGATSRSEIIASVFRISPDVIEEFYASSLLRLMNTIKDDELGDTVLHAMVSGHRGVQSIVLKVSLERMPGLALDLFALVDLADASVGTGGKSLLLDALIRESVATDEMIHRSLDRGIPVQVRRAVVLALGKARSHLCATALPLASSDPDVGVRASAVKLAEHVSTDAALAAVAALIQDPSEDVRRAARKLLVRSTAIGDGDLVAWLGRSLTAETRLAVVSVLYGRGHRFSLEVAVRIARDKDYRVRRYGRNVLTAMSRDGSLKIGRVYIWRPRRRKGVVYRLDTGEELLFAEADVVGPRLPAQGALVTFSVDFRAGYARDVVVLE